MFSYQGITDFFGRLLGRRGDPTPAEIWLAQRATAGPEETIRQHFAAMNAHDLDWLLATLCPERARLYNDPRTTDRKRLTISQATILGIAAQDVRLDLPLYVGRYRSSQIYRVDYSLELVTQEERRDPSVKNGEQWAYYVLVTDGKNGWMLADWGR